MQIKPLACLHEMDSVAWNTLAGSGYPFLRHEFLSALEQSGCVGGKTGWLPQHITVWEGETLVAVMPMYRKSHSSGEYVFDHAWANFYHQNAVAYYPKWLTAIPFTPCQGPRLACLAGVDAAKINRAVFDFIRAQAEIDGISSWHGLFPLPDQLAQCQNLGLNIREGVQFQWFNRGYRDFSDFLDAMTASKRKMIKRERRKVTEQGIEFLMLTGDEASDVQWQVFYQFYALTYLKKSSQPYLNLDFFLRCAARMGEQMRLVLAIKDQRYVGAALSFIGGDTFYGRYWGCYEEYNFLHFEACYYQGLDYCLANGLQRFDSGAQGEHKIARGFEPVTTYSAHWLKEARFAKPIADFLAREKIAIQDYRADAARHLPFKTPENKG
ncbi:GNAT family N-acetyltransferase [Methylosoma difficile]